MTLVPVVSSLAVLPAPGLAFPSLLWSLCVVD